ncbi:MAG: hypothetical protein IJP68_07495, partial [Selenomonadaceae bacterium]|nr:hypothetical protein [Selenomonadaceae bacterium]
LTIKGGKGKSLGMIDSAGKAFSTIVGGSSSGGSTTLTVTDKTKSPVTIASSVKTVNASKRTKAVKITGNKLANSIAGGSKNDSLYGGEGNDTILGNAGNDKLYGQAGNDYLSGGKGNDSIAGGAGNNTLTGGAGNDVFFYGGGNDLITDYAEGDKIKIASGFVSSINPSGNDVVFTVGKGKITVTGAADKTITYIDANGEQDYSDSATSEFNIKGSTIKLMPTYLNETFNIVDYGATLQNVDASAVLLDMEITGNALRNSILGGENNETLIGGKGNDTLTGGTGSDVFLYNNGDGNDVITDYSEEDFIQFTTGTAKVKRSGKDVVFTLGKGTITVTGGASKIITYADAKGEHSYPEVVDINGAGTKITLLENYIKDTFDVADYDDGIKTIDASAVAHDLEITGNKLMNSIKGGEGNDTLWGGKGNDTLTGGNGSDVFVYSNGDGNDLITDYNEEDKIKIVSGKVSVKKNGKNVIFTVGSGKITVTGAASKTVTYIDANGKTNYFPTTPAESIIWKDSNKTAILRETYSETTFIASDYNASIKTIDASSVTHNIKITGNGKANQILGGYENDTLRGGKGNDTLQGGSGADVFTYANGDGNDRIVDYAEEDTIQITKGKAQVAVSGNDVIFTIGSGKISVLGAVGKTVSYIEGGKTKTYGSASNVLEDDNF